MVIKSGPMGEMVIECKEVRWQLQGLEGKQRVQRHSHGAWPELQGQQGKGQEPSLPDSPKLRAGGPISLCIAGKGRSREKNHSSKAHS